ncbi:MAG: cation transporting ATPase C-terminal domain-containing protein, partial [Microgenomates group bacterium]
ADIGISVNNAVDVAKEAADLILLHKDLKILHTGILEGRKTFANVLKYIVMGTSSTFGNMLSLAASSLFLPFLPMLPVQVLLNDLLYDASQTLVAQDNVDRELVEKPRKWNVAFIKNYMLTFGTLSSLFDLFTFFLLFTIFKATPQLFRTGWFLESILTQILIIFSIRTAKVPFWKSKASLTFTLSLLGIVAFALFLPNSFLAKDFHFVKLPILFYPALLIIVLCYFLATEIVKSLFYAKHQWPSETESE